MKKKRKKIRKSELIGHELEKRANKLFGKLDNKPTKTLLKPVVRGKTEEEFKKITERFIKSMQGKNFKPLFS